jgi:hypothetical protein
MFTHRLKLVVALLIALVLGSAQTPAEAQTVIEHHVKATDDTIDANPGDGICADVVGNCTLRAAIMEANARPGGDKIFLPAGRYVLSQDGESENDAVNGDLDIRDDIAIFGDGAKSTIIDGNDATRVFHLLTKDFISKEPFHAWIANVSIINGKTNRNGGGVLATCSTVVALDRVEVYNNEAANGGGIAVESCAGYTTEVKMYFSAVFDNDALSIGGAVYIKDQLNYDTDKAIFKADNNTFTNNTASISGGIYAEGVNTHVTVAYNTIINNLSSSDTGNGINVKANVGGGSIFRNIIAFNKLLSGDTITDCQINTASVTSIHNLLSAEGVDQCIGDVSTQIYLGTFAYHNSFTQHYPLLPGNPAIDAVPCEILYKRDQRFVNRPQGSACDLGSFERKADDVIPTATATSTSTVVPTNTATIEPTATATSTPDATVAPTLTATVRPDVTATTEPQVTASTTVEPQVTATTTPEATATAAPGEELLINGDFELRRGDGKPDMDPWEVKKASGDKVKCNKPGKIIAHGGTCAFAFKGGAGENSKLYRTIGYPWVEAGGTLNFSAWVNANSAPNSKIKVTVFYNDGVTANGKIIIDLRATSGYEPVNDSLTIAAEVLKIKVDVSYKSPSGKMMIDDLSLRYLEANSGLVPLPR